MKIRGFENVKNILFDLGGVIATLSKKNAIARFREIGFADIDEYLGEFRQKGIFLDYESGKISAEDFYNEFRRLGNNQATDEDIDDAWMKFIVEIPDYKYKLLKELGKHYRVLLLSNTNPSVEKWLRSPEFSPSGETIDDFFERCFMSFEIGSAKPEKEIFEHVIREAKIVPGETLFLDDGPDNLKTAKEMGFQVYLANQDEDLRDLFIQQ